MRTHLLIGAALLLIGAGCGKPTPPPQAQIDVPFTSQAPEGNWAEPWQNACEETTIYMVSSFYAEDDIRRDEAVKRIREIFKVKNAEFSASKDESLATIQQLIEELGLPWKADIVENPTVDDLKAELAAGRPIIVPVYAPDLGNHRYKYHVMVLTGYDDETGEFIVNDPGTQGGEGQRYKYDTFMGAIHDLSNPSDGSGKKAVLFTWQDGWTEWFSSESED
jgi:hypothetical protein